MCWKISLINNLETWYKKKTIRKMAKNHIDYYIETKAVIKKIKMRRVSGNLIVMIPA
jgi:hypothetical protein